MATAPHHAIRRLQSRITRRSLSERRRARATMLRNHRDDRHFSAILTATLREDSSLVDVGANVGGVLEQAVRLAPRGHHVAFEPIPRLASDLARRFPEVSVHAAAAADHSGRATFHWVETVDALSGLELPKAHLSLGSTEIEVPLERLDDVVTHPPRVIKIDVEGGEEGVLRGAQAILQKHRPLVMFEHGLAAAAYGTQSETIHDLLSRPGLRVFDMDGGGPLDREAFVAIVHRGEHFNFLAH